MLELAEEELLGERALDLLLDDPVQGPRPELGIVASLGEERARAGREPDRHPAVPQLPLQLTDELVDDAAHHLAAERPEVDLRVEAVAELGAEEAAVLGVALVLGGPLAEADQARRILDTVEAVS